MVEITILTMLEAPLTSTVQMVSALFFGLHMHNDLSRIGQEMIIGFARAATWAWQEW
jgi:hypothetical protein